MSAGGDGSPQLDIDAIKRRPAKNGGWAFDAVQETVSLSRKERDGLLALVRRLQQENKELRAPFDEFTTTDEPHGWVPINVDELNALRGRVEELTAHIDRRVARLQHLHTTTAHFDTRAGAGLAIDELLAARALLARVDPEKENHTL